MNVFMVETTHYFIFQDPVDFGCTFMTEDDWYIRLIDQGRRDDDSNPVYLNASFVRFDFGN